MNINEVKQKEKGELDLIKLALTISPPNIKYMTVPEIMNKHLRYLSRMKCKFVLYPELDKTGRLHYHGYIYKSDIGYKEDLELLKKIGYIKIKDISNNKGWLQYCKKEWKTTRKLLHRREPITNNDCIGLTDSYDLSKYGILSNT